MSSGHVRRPALLGVSVRRRSPGKLRTAALAAAFLGAAPAAAYSVLHSHAPGPGAPRAGVIADASGNLYGATVAGGVSNRGTVFALKPDGTGLSVLHSFAGGAGDGESPESSPVLDASGNLYGTTNLGGASNVGIVFRLKTDGTGYSVLHTFTGGVGDGRYPYASLTLDTAGNLYGTTVTGGASDLGTVFTLKTDGTGFEVLHSFAGGAGDGEHPRASLVLDTSGNLYGTTHAGGEWGLGTVFTLKADGTGFAVVHSFAGGAADGQWPYASPVLDASGELHGTTLHGGAANRGTVYTLKTDGTGFSVLHSFEGSEGAADGEKPYASLIADASGNLYGTTCEGGPSKMGTVFTLKTDGTGFTVLHAFDWSAQEGSNSFAPLVLDASGNLFGTTLHLGASGRGTVFKLRTDGTGFTVLHTFPAGDGQDPQASLILDASGNLYGATVYGGGLSGRGAIFTLKTDGTGFSNLHEFAGSPGDGAEPRAALVLDAFGNLYGTTYGGGASGRGTVFTLRTDGTGLSLLHSFAGGAADGDSPLASLILDASGNLYGTTLHGGSANRGTVFTLRTDGTGFSVLHSFAGGAGDGQDPRAPLLLDASGSLYGTTYYGGASNRGTLFTLRTDGAGFAVLRSFTGGTGDGQAPSASLISDASGNLYGTTINGNEAGNGIVFTVKADGTGFSILHLFAEGSGDGWNPYASLVLDAFGNLFGTTFYGGAANAGTVFTLKTDGTGFALLHSFTGGADDGKNTFAPLILDAFGNLYGTTIAGGAANMGTVFTLPSPRTATRFYTLGPCRLLDTRGPDGALGGPALRGGLDRSFVVTGAEPCGVPSTARALSLNVTVTVPATAGYLTLHPGGGGAAPDVYGQLRGGADTGEQRDRPAARGRERGAGDLRGNRGTGARHRGRERVLPVTGQGSGLKDRYGPVSFILKP